MVSKEIPFHCRVDAFIDDEIEKSRIAIFSKTTCKYSLRAKSLLDSLGYNYNTVELDEMLENGTLVQERLLLRTGQATVPNIFINHQHLGGCEDLEYLHECGILDEVIAGLLDVHQKFDYDIAVIGGGSAGISAAMSSAKNGKSVCLVDFVKPTPHGVSWGIGGTCTNVGCVPKKLVHRAAVLGSDLRDASLFGWEMPEEDIQHNWSKLVATVQEHVEKVNWTIRKDLISNGIAYINGLAHLKDNHRVIITFQDETEKMITVRNIVIAVGARPRYLDLPGADECITSDEIFSLKDFPGRTLIIGGSYVALEVASFLNSLKAEVTVMVRSEILNSFLFDRDMADNLEMEMMREGVTFIHNCTILKIANTGGMFQVDTLVDEASPYGDAFNTVILAVGRIPCTDTLKLDNVGIKLCSNCKISVNERDQTSVKNIFAIGDCANGRPELSSAALTAGRLLAKRLKKADCKCIVNYRCIPTSIFTWPEYACSGNSESTAKKLYGETFVKVYTSTVTPLEQAVTEPAAKCYAKLVTVFDQTKIERLAGFHIVGPNASEIIQGFALALRMGASKKDLDFFIGIHPTCAEIFTNLTLKGEPEETKC